MKWKKIQNLHEAMCFLVKEEQTAVPSAFSKKLYSKEAFDCMSKESFNAVKVSSVFIQVSKYSSMLFKPTLCCWKWELTKQC